MDRQTLINRAEARSGVTFQDFGYNLADRNTQISGEFRHFYQAVGSIPCRVVLNNKPRIEASIEPINASDLSLDSIEPDVYFLEYALESPEEVSLIREEFSFTERDRHRLHGSHIGDINHKDVPTHEDILDQATETIDMLKAAAMDLDLNPEIASSVRDYYMRLRKIEPGNYPFVFDNLRPHPECPINSETYDQLCNLIEEIHQGIGVSKKDYTYASAQASPDSPVVDLYYNRGPKELKNAGVTLKFDKYEIKFSLNNDAGTVELPWQVAGSRSATVDGFIAVVDLSALLSEEDVLSLIGGLSDLHKNNLFIKKHMTLRY